MTVNNEYTSIHSLLNFIANTGIEPYEMFDASTDTVDVSSIRVVGKYFSFDFYLTKNRITFSEFGFNKIPKTCIDLSEIKEISFENKVLSITLKNGNPYVIDFNSLNESVSMYITEN